MGGDTKSCLWSWPHGSHQKEFEKEQENDSNMKESGWGDCNSCHLCMEWKSSLDGETRILLQARQKGVPYSWRQREVLWMKVAPAVPSREHSSIKLINLRFPDLFSKLGEQSIRLVLLLLCLTSKRKCPHRPFPHNFSTSKVRQRSLVHHHQVPINRFRNSGSAHSARETG